MAVRKATRKAVKLRGAFYSASGGGKTFSCLRVATGLAMFENGGRIPESGRGRVRVIDSEHGASELYADRFDFDVHVLEGKTIADYTAAINMAAADGVSVLIIDSLTHAWRELLEQVDLDKANSRSGNGFQAWGKATPVQKEFIETILSFPGHIMATMRADTLWDVGDNENGKKTPKRIGMKPEQGKGIEFEFTFLVYLDVDHSCLVEKDRTGKFQDRRIKLLDEGFGRELGEWLASGVKPATFAQLEEIKALCKQNGIGGKRFGELVGAVPTTYEEAEAALAKVRDADPLGSALADTAAALADVAKTANPPVPTAAPTTTVGEAAAQPSSATGTSAGSLAADATPPPPSTETPQTSAKTATTTTTTAEDEAAEVMAGGGDDTTTTLIAFKRSVDAASTAPNVAALIADWTPKLATLSERPRLIANGYALARVKELGGEALTENDNRLVSALNTIAKE
jgi:hypothetical protein